MVPELPATLRLGPVHLTVSTLDGSITFYECELGLRVHDRDERVATLGTGGEDLLVLAEETDAAPGGRHAGLYHYALRFEERRELARAVKRLASTQTRIENASDHGVLEAIYLRDPDDNGIELYANRPRSRWPARIPGDRVEMPTIALDLEDLMRSVDGEGPACARGCRTRRRSRPPARGRRRAGAGLLPRRTRLRRHDRPRRRGIRGGLLVRDPWETAVAFRVG